VSTTIAEAAGDLPRRPAIPAPPPLARVLATLVRREFWEHRYLWLVPLVVAGLLACCALLGHIDWDFGRDPAFQGAAVAHATRVALATIVQWAISVPLYVVLLLVVNYYALDCLYAERKDRSILFWKSLPVSDALTVGSKLLVAVVVAPLGVFVLATATHLLFDAILGARIAAGNLPPFIEWNTLEWLRAQLVILLLLGLAILWYAPLVAALMLVSAWARRSPFLWSTLPPLIAPLLERIALGSHHLWDFYRYRTFGIWHTLQDGYRFRVITRHEIHPLGTLLGDLHFRAAYTDIDLWLGVLAAGALLFAAVRIRRYRDDS
jgi:ABC-2 type transport system permease protein